MTTAALPDNIQIAPVNPFADQPWYITFSMPILVGFCGLITALAFAFLPWINFEGKTISRMIDLGLLVDERVRVNLLFLILLPIAAILCFVVALRMVRSIRNGYFINAGVRTVAWVMFAALLYFFLFTGQYYKSLLDGLEQIGLGYWICFLAMFLLFFRVNTLRFFGILPDRYMPQTLVKEKETKTDEVMAILRDEGTFKRGMARRKAQSNVWAGLFLGANVFALIALVVLFLNIVNQSFGYVVYTYEIKPTELTKDFGGKPINQLSQAEVLTILEKNVEFSRLRVLVRDNLIGRNIDRTRLTSEPMKTLIAGKKYSTEVGEKKFAELNQQDAVKLLTDNLSQAQLVRVLERDVTQATAAKSWTLSESLLQKAEIDKTVASDYPNAVVEWRAWLNLDFLTSELTAEPATTGLRMSLIGSAWIIILTILIALPLGVGAAIYLEEYAQKNRLNSIIETNIRNLSGVPSIIYGMLGLAVFARTFEFFTSGQFLGITDSSGRSVISAAFTMALLILPVVVINSQEAIRAVPPSIREASFGVGATKWQTIYRQVLPAAVPGILTGLILSISRAIGETAPLLVVGGLTFMTIDPNGPFSKFSVVPIQIFSWTGDANQSFRNVAAAAIIILLVLLLSLNTIAILIRQRFSKTLRG
jgi:phosphate transport system permease protein